MSKAYRLLRQYKNRWVVGAITALLMGILFLAGYLVAMLATLPLQWLFGWGEAFQYNAQIFVALLTVPIFVGEFVRQSAFHDLTELGDTSGRRVVSDS